MPKKKTLTKAKASAVAVSAKNKNHLETKPKGPTVVERDRYNNSVTFSDGIFMIVDLNKKPRSDTVSFQATPRKWKELKKMKEAAARALAWKLEKEAKAAAAALAAKAKTQERNRTYVTKMLSLPKLVFTDQMLRFMLQEGVADILVSFITQVQPAPSGSGDDDEGGDPSRSGTKEVLVRPVRGDPLTDPLRKSYRAAMLLAGPEPTEALGVFVESRAQLLFRSLFQVFSPRSSGSYAHACHVIDCLIDYDVDMCVSALSSSRADTEHFLGSLLSAIEHPPVAATLHKLIRCEEATPKCKWSLYENCNEFGLFRKLARLISPTSNGGSSGSSRATEGSGAASRAEAASEVVAGMWEFMLEEDVLAAELLLKPSVKTLVHALVQAATSRTPAASVGVGTVPVSSGARPRLAAIHALQSLASRAGAYESDDEPGDDDEGGEEEEEADLASSADNGAGKAVENDEEGKTAKGNDDVDANEEEEKEARKEKEQTNGSSNGSDGSKFAELALLLEADALDAWVGSMDLKRRNVAATLHQAARNHLLPSLHECLRHSRAVSSSPSSSSSVTGEGGQEQSQNQQAGSNSNSPMCSVVHVVCSVDLAAPLGVGLTSQGFIGHLKPHSQFMQALPEATTPPPSSSSASSFSPHMLLSSSSSQQKASVFVAPQLSISVPIPWDTVEDIDDVVNTPPSPLSEGSPGRERHGCDEGVDDEDTHHREHSESDSLLFAPPESLSFSSNGSACTVNDPTDRQRRKQKRKQQLTYQRLPHYVIVPGSRIVAVGPPLAPPNPLTPPEGGGGHASGFSSGGGEEAKDDDVLKRSVCVSSLDEFSAALKTFRDNGLSHARVVVQVPTAATISSAATAKAASSSLASSFIEEESAGANWKSEKDDMKRQLAVPLEDLTALVWLVAEMADVQPKHLDLFASYAAAVSTASAEEVAGSSGSGENGAYAANAKHARESLWGLLTALFFAFPRSDMLATGVFKLFEVALREDHAASLRALLVHDPFFLARVSAPLALSTQGSEKGERPMPTNPTPPPSTSDPLLLPLPEDGTEGGEESSSTEENKDVGDGDDDGKGYKAAAVDSAVVADELKRDGEDGEGEEEKVRNGEKEEKVNVDDDVEKEEGEEGDSSISSLDLEELEELPQPPPPPPFPPCPPCAAAAALAALAAASEGDEANCLSSTADDDDDEHDEERSSGEYNGAAAATATAGGKEQPEVGGARSPSPPTIKLVVVIPVPVPAPGLPLAQALRFCKELREAAVALPSNSLLPSALRKHALWTTDVVPRLLALEAAWTEQGMGIAMGGTRDFDDDSDDDDEEDEEEENEEEGEEKDMDLNFNPYEKSSGDGEKDDQDEDQGEDQGEEAEAVQDETDDLSKLLLEFGLSNDLYQGLYRAGGGGGSFAHVVQCGVPGMVDAGVNKLKARKLWKAAASGYKAHQHQKDADEEFKKRGQQQQEGPGEDGSGGDGEAAAEATTVASAEKACKIDVAAQVEEGDDERKEEAAAAAAVAAAELEEEALRFVREVVQLVPYSVLGQQLAQEGKEKLLVQQAPLPSEVAGGGCVLVDPAGLHHIQPPSGPSGAGGAAGAIYKAIGIAQDKHFPEDVVEAVTKTGKAKYHMYTTNTTAAAKSEPSNGAQAAAAEEEEVGKESSKTTHVIHVVGPDLRKPFASTSHGPSEERKPQPGGPYTRAQAVESLSTAYKNVLTEFVGCGMSALRLLPVSGGIFSGSFLSEMPELTFEALRNGFCLLGAEERSALLLALSRGPRGEEEEVEEEGGEKKKSLLLCVFDEKELPCFLKAGFTADTTTLAAAAAAKSKAFAEKRENVEAERSIAAEAEKAAAAAAAAMDAKEGGGGLKGDPTEATASMTEAELAWCSEMRLGDERGLQAASATVGLPGGPPTHAAAAGLAAKQAAEKVAQVAARDLTPESLGKQHYTSSTAASTPFALGVVAGTGKTAESALGESKKDEMRNKDGDRGRSETEGKKSRSAAVMEKAKAAAVALDLEDLAEATWTRSLPSGPRDDDDDDARGGNGSRSTGAAGQEPRREGSLPRGDGTWTGSTAPGGRIRPIKAPKKKPPSCRFHRPVVAVSWSATASAATVEDI